MEREIEDRDKGIRWRVKERGEITGMHDVTARSVS